MSLTVAAQAARLPDYGGRLRVGLIVPSQNVVAEADLHAALPPGVSLLTTRLALRGGSAGELRAMGDAAIDAALLLADARPDLIVFHCTAASTVDLEAGDRIAAAIEARTGIGAFCTSQALVAALRALRVGRLVMLTPYSKAVTDAETRFLEHHGFDVLEALGLDLTALGRPMAQVPQREWVDRLAAMRRADAQAYFLSCTNIQAMPVLDSLEAALGAPVLGSNQVTLWHLLRRGGLSDVVDGFGRLLRIA